MLKINFFQFVYDRVWFGWYIHSIIKDDMIVGRYFQCVGDHRRPARGSYWSRSRWKRAMFLHDKWFPIRLYNTSPPNWWLKLCKAPMDFDPNHYEEFFGND